MTNAQYKSGNRYEVKLCGLLEADGYVCWQARNSRGAADVIALKPGQVVLIQVKSGAGEISGREWNALWELADGLGAVAVSAHWTPRKPVELVRLAGPHRDGSPYWPMVQWYPDEADAALWPVESVRRTRYEP